MIVICVLRPPWDTLDVVPAACRLLWKTRHIVLVRELAGKAGARLSQRAPGLLRSLIQRRQTITMIPEQTPNIKPGPRSDDPLLAGLTDPQREAVLHDHGPLLVLAAAGSGKTRVITRRIARLVRDGVAPWRILALTFTNKAAGEMRERVEEMLGSGAAARGLTVTTFHSLCARLLRRSIDLANIPGLTSSYAIYDSADQMALMKRVIQEAGLSTSNWPPRSVLSAISNAKNDLKSASVFAAEAGDFYSRTIAKLYERYEAALRRANAVDFDDLLLLTVKMLSECAEAREEAQSRWTHLMIDEYQDTNKAQFVLASLLIGKSPTPLGEGADGEGADAQRTTLSAVPALGPNICVVGDPDQSIYGWRGADISNILEFEEQYPGARVIALGQNFRSTAPILSVADTLIRHNKRRKHKDLFTTREGGADVVAIMCRDERHEAERVVTWFRELQLEEGLNWKDMAVLYRTNALSRVMEDALRVSGVPYVIARGTAFYEREEVKDALAYLRVVANPFDDVSLRRIVNKPARGVGASSLKAAELFAQTRHLPLLDALGHAAAGAVEGVSQRAAPAIEKFIAQIDSWTEQGRFLGAEMSGSLSGLVERVIKESGLEKHYQKKQDKSDIAGEERTENLAELISSAHEFELEYQPEDDPANDAQNAEIPPLLAMLRAYLESVALVADADAVDPENGAITLMTLHAAKGLEFPAVAMIGLEDGLLPHSRARESEAELEEERRLAFVGITRAERHLLLTAARRRTNRGVSERTIPSQFLSEIEPAGVVYSDQSDTWDDWSEPRSEEYDDVMDIDVSERLASARTYSAPRPKNDALPVGCMVRHPQFGVGRVTAVLSAASEPRARIDFKGVGVKTLVLRYARLERVE